MVFVTEKLMTVIVHKSKKNINMGVFISLKVTSMNIFQSMEHQRFQVRAKDYQTRRMNVRGYS